MLILWILSIGFVVFFSFFVDFFLFFLYETENKNDKPNFV